MLVLAAGLAALVVLLSRLDAKSVLGIASLVGWWILPLLALPAVPLALDALAWRLSFPPEDSESYSVVELGKLWLAMDGLNYLVPTLTVGGEVARGTMLGEARPPEVRAASVLVSRAAQTLAQLTLVLVGLVFLVSRLPLLRSHAWVTTTGSALLGIVVSGFVAYVALARRLIPTETDAGARDIQPTSWLRRVPRLLRLYFARHPARFAGAVSLFAAAYAWTTLETYWICRLIGVPVGAVTAMTIETLSLALDGVLYVVPARIGVQELGKAGVFVLLGFPARFGVAFGVVRHVRELVWAAAGFLIYATSRRTRDKTASL